MEPTQSDPPQVKETVGADVSMAVNGQVNNVKKNVSTREISANNRPSSLKQSIEFKVAPKTILRIYVIPIVAIIVLFAVLVFFVIPSVNNIFTTLDQVSVINAESLAADETLIQLEQLVSRQTELQNDLDKIRELAPSGITQVTAFQQKIVSLAESQNLQVTETTLEETILTSEGDDVTANLGLIEIPSRFTVSGSFQQLSDFVGLIQSLDDFVIIGEMTLRTNQIVNITNLSEIAGDDWTLTLTLVKYQFQQPDETNQLEAFYSNVPPSIQLEQEVIEFARNRELVTL